MGPSMLVLGSYSLGAYDRVRQKICYQSWAVRPGTGALSSCGQVFCFLPSSLLNIFPDDFNVGIL